MATSPFRRFASRLLADGFVFRKHRKLGVRVINKTGASIAADKIVAISGYDTTAKLPKIVLADADTAAHTDIYVTLSNAIADAKEGYVYKGGLSAATLDTSAVAAAGDPVFLSTTAGAFSATNNGRPVGYAITDSATVGQIHWELPMDTPMPSGAGIKAINLTSVTQDIGSIAADATLTVTFTVTGVAAGDAVVVMPPAALEANVMSTVAWVTAADTVTVILENETTGAIDPASAAWKFLWFDLT